jgi:hypothetical protein
MPFYLHSSGTCTFSDAASLKPGDGGSKEYGIIRSRRSVFFDRCAPLWYWYSRLNFFTFTIPEVRGTDRDYSSAFSALLENIRKNYKIKSYVWVAEVQEKRGIKYKIKAPLHFHMVTHGYLPIQWLNSYWCSLINCYSPNAVDVQHVPPEIDCLPAYLAKYMCKPMSRVMRCRSFGSTQDLKLPPIKLDAPPPNPYGVQVRTFYEQGEKRETIVRYYKTAMILEKYFQI